jgi:hypothetical protein
MGRKVMFLLMVGLGVVRGWDTRNAETKKPPTPFQEAAVGSGRRFCSEDFSLRTSDEFPHPATLGVSPPRLASPAFAEEFLMSGGKLSMGSHPINAPVCHKSTPRS